MLETSNPLSVFPPSDHQVFFTQPARTAWGETERVKVHFDIYDTCISGDLLCPSIGPEGKTCRAVIHGKIRLPEAIYTVQLFLRVFHTVRAIEAYYTVKKSIDMQNLVLMEGFQKAYWEKNVEGKRYESSRVTWHLSDVWNKLPKFDARRWWSLLLGQVSSDAGWCGWWRWTT